MNVEEAVLSLIKQMSNMAENILLLGESVEDTKRNFLEIGKIHEFDIERVSERWQVERNNLQRMVDHLMGEVLDLKKIDNKTFEKIANVESQVQAKTDLLQVRAIKSLNILNFGRTGRK